MQTVREVASGAAKHAQRDELLNATRRRELDAILVWKLDRWGAPSPISSPRSTS